MDEVDTNQELDSAFDSALSGSDDSVQTESPVGTEETADEGEGLVSEESADSSATTEDTEVPAAEATDPEEQAEGKGFRVSANRMSAFREARDFSNEVRQFAPSVEAAKQNFHHASDLRAMAREIRNPLEESASVPGKSGVEAFVDFWLGESPNSLEPLYNALQSRLERNPEAWQKVSGKFTSPETLSKSASWSQIREQAVESYLTELYTKALGNEQAFYKAQLAEYNLSGKYRTPEQIQKPDPMLARTQELEARERQIQQAEARQQQSAQQETARLWNTVSGRIDSQKQAGVQKAINEALAPVKGKFDEPIIGAIRSRVEALVKEKLDGDFEWRRDHNLDLAQIKRGVQSAVTNQSKLTEQNQAIQAFVESYVARVAPLVKAEAAKLVNTQTASMVKNNKQTRSHLANSQKRGTTAGRPAPQSIAPKPGASFDSAFDQLWG